MTRMKRATWFVLAVLLVALSIAPSASASSGYRFEADPLGIRMEIDDRWLDMVNAGKLSYWVRADQTPGYALLYVTPTLEGFAPKTYEAGEAWLNENAFLLGGVMVSSQRDTPLPAPYAAFARDRLDKAGTAYFDAFRPANPDWPSVPDAYRKIAKSVYAAIADKDVYHLFDPAASAAAGVLGSFDTHSLVDGAHVTDALISDAKVTVVYFWSTTCNPCIKGLPAVDKAAKAFADRDVSFLGVTIDAFDDDTKARAAEILADAGVSFPNIDPVISYDALRAVEYTPTTLFLDARGRSLGEPAVGALTAKQLTNILNDLLDD